ENVEYRHVLADVIREILRIDADGLRPTVLRAQDAFRGDDQIEAEVVLRLGDLVANQLQRMHRRRDASPLVDTTQRAADGGFEIRVAAALAKPSAGARDRY